MSKLDRLVTLCLLLIAGSFWVPLVWAYLTDQPKSSFYVGPGVVVWGVVAAIDMALWIVAMVSGAYALRTGEVTKLHAAKKWLFLVLVIGISFYFEVQTDLHVHPFFRKED